MHMNSICNIQEEQKCIKELGLENSDSLFNKKQSYIRRTLRLLEYNKYVVHGKVVNLFQKYQPANLWVESRMRLSSTEWRDAIKLQVNLASVKALHGRSQYNSRSRHCNERETLHHVLGFCHYEELFRNNVII